MKLLLDTCAFIWTVTEPEKLTQVVWNTMVEPENEIYVSSLALWETIHLYKKGRIDISKMKSGYLEKVCRQQEVRVLTFNHKDADLLLTLPDIHKDPFDRMLICQAMNNKLTLVTPDKKIHQYKDVSVMW